MINDTTIIDVTDDEQGLDDDESRYQELLQRASSPVEVRMPLEEWLATDRSLLFDTLPSEGDDE